jgi:hypothetical protein
MRVAFKAVLMLSLIAITEVVRGELSLLLMILRSLRVRPFLVEGALGVGWVLATAGAGFVAGVVTFFLGLLTTFAHVGAGWVVVDLGGGGGGHGEDSKADFGSHREVVQVWRKVPATQLMMVSLALTKCHLQGGQGNGGSQLW